MENCRRKQESLQGKVNLKTLPSEAKDFMGYSQEDYLTVTFTIIFVPVKIF